ncbi:ankyrin repeat domain-containing protein SOWAHA-like [Mugil cephalus]|uniref:ankyrin repeat domain-containing protein SOWAHA-like n=1 Tax=Mugil cephalus TaxID=48193 RepID=UPI001FB6E7B0|nr:ankyrin repeat domain-containing protein SOWAHA-like [Mugil cephalus]
MALTQEAVLSLLIAEGGKVKKSELVARFKGAIDCVDPAQKERNKDMFKTFVNDVACVKEIDGVRYVVLKKTYQRLVEGKQSEGSPEEKRGNGQSPETGEQQRPPAQEEKTEPSEDKPDGPCSEEDSESCDSLFPIEMALQRSKYPQLRVKKMLNFDIHKQDTDKPRATQSKPYALPLRMAPITSRVEVRHVKLDPENPPKSPILDQLRSKKRASSLETAPRSRSSSLGSPQLGRSAKSAAKASEEPRDTRIPSMVPLEQAEHEWMVKCATGHWSQVYGLLLRDVQLAEKRDFMSGFTALHWAAKCGNCEMLTKIMDVSRQKGIDVDVNVKTHGGYTPLHIAALHGQGYVITMLVKEYGADVTVRDDCGKKAYHYLGKDFPSEAVREMLGEPKAQQQQAQERPLSEREEPDLFPDLSKGLHSISRLFQPNVTAIKKKSKHRLGLYSLADEVIEEREETGFRPRLASDVFM